MHRGGELGEWFLPARRTDGRASMHASRRRATWPNDKTIARDLTCSVAAQK